MADSTCSVEGCDGRARARGWCTSHYNRWYYEGNAWRAVKVCAHPGCAATRPAAASNRWKWCERHVRDTSSRLTKDERRMRRDAAVKACPTCGESFTPATTLAQKFCSAVCRSAYHARAKREATAARRAAQPKSCPRCAVEFVPELSSAQVYCSDACSRAWAEGSNPARCSIAGCDRPHRAIGMCSMHWRRKARAEGREKAPEWDDRRRANYQRRRAAKSTADAELVDSATVFERDGYECGICREPVGRELTYPDPLSASLDHILPLAKGGTHTYDNVQCAHLRCNIRKGASYPQEV